MYVPSTTTTISISRTIGGYSRVRTHRICFQEVASLAYENDWKYKCMYAVLPITSWKSDRAVVEVFSEQCRPQLSAAIGGSSRDVSVKVGSDHCKGSAIAVLRKQASELLRCRPASRSKSAVEYRVHQV
jgi:hypothetical protein